VGVVDTATDRPYRSEQPRLPTRCRNTHDMYCCETQAQPGRLALGRSHAISNASTAARQEEPRAGCLCSWVRCSGERDGPDRGRTATGFGPFGHFKAVRCAGCSVCWLFGAGRVVGVCGPVGVARAVAAPVAVRWHRDDSCAVDGVRAGQASGSRPGSSARHLRRRRRVWGIGGSGVTRPVGSAWGAEIGVITAAAAAAGTRFAAGTVPVWRLAMALSRARLLTPGWPDFTGRQ
jgi:hypothetical protein